MHVRNWVSVILPSKTFDLNTVISEIEFSKAESLEAIAKMRSVVESKEDKVVAQASVPIYYSAWEKFFKDCVAIGLKVVANIYNSAGDADAQKRVFWILKEPEFKSFVDVIRSIIEISYIEAESEQRNKFRKRVTKGLAQDTARIVEWFDRFNSERFSPKLDYEELPLTFSNVNKDVIEVNLKLLGGLEEDQYDSDDYKTLDELVGTRNAIVHGGVKVGVGNKRSLQFCDEISWSIRRFGNVMEGWAHSKIA